MKKYPLIILLVAVTGLTACKGGDIKCSIAPSSTPNVKFVPAENTVEIKGMRRVAILPFADYSHQQDSLVSLDWGGNIKILEEITDQLSSHGISVVVQEDVNTLLVDNDIIRPIDDQYLINGTFEEEETELNDIGTPEHELANYKHSPTMQNEILRIISRKEAKKKKGTKSPVVQGATVGLTKDKIIEFGQILGADVIIRGRIIDYGYKDIGTINPLYRGVVPVVIDSVKDILFGTASSYDYEADINDAMIENMIIGAAMGAAIGNNIVSGHNSTHTSVTNGLIATRKTTTHRSHDDRALEGAGIGAAAGWLTSQHPKKAKRSAVVQVRVYAQDTTTGDVLWTNRAEIEYIPKSNFAYNETHPKVMFDKAVKKGIEELMGSFFSNTSAASAAL